MEAKALMTKKIVTIKAETPIQRAYELMLQHKIRHLPVVDLIGRVVGMISDRDIARAMNVRTIGEIEQVRGFNPHDTAESFMSWPVQAVDEHMALEQVAKLMLENKVSALVVNAPNHYLKGLITTDDLLLYLIEILTTKESSPKETLSQLMWRPLD